MSLTPDRQRCALCGTESPLIIAHLGLCGTCIQSRFEQARPLIQAAHAETRRVFDLPFAPNFYVPDLSPTSVGHAEASLAAAHAAGLINVRVGNRHLLSPDH